MSSIHAILVCPECTTCVLPYSKSVHSTSGDSEIVGGARVFKTGALENEDNFLTGLNLGARYVDVTAKITDIASASYMDIVARINTSPELVKQYTNNLQKTIDDGADKVGEAYSGLNALAGVESNTKTAESNNE